MNKQMTPEPWHMILFLQRVTIPCFFIAQPFSNQTSKISSSKKASLPSLSPPPKHYVYLCSQNNCTAPLTLAVRPLGKARSASPSVAPFPEKPAQNKWVDE